MTHRAIIFWAGGIAVTVLSIGLFVLAPLFERTPYPCNVPSLETEIPMTTIVSIPRVGYFVESCPTPIPQEAQLEREYGVIRLHWWGSPHRLYMAGTATTGRPLIIGGARVEPFDSRQPDSFLADYTSRVTFVESSVADATAAETFTIEVRDDAELREEIELRYVPRQCTCVYGF